MKKANNFQIMKVQPQGVVSFCLIFCQFLPGVAYKSVAYKKKVYILMYSCSRTRYFIQLLL